MAVFFCAVEGLGEIRKAYNEAFPSEGKDEQIEIVTLQDENRALAKQLQQTYGWYWLIPECAEYWRCSGTDILRMPAMDVLGIIKLMQQKAEYIKLTQSNGNNK